MFAAYGVLLAFPAAFLFQGILKIPFSFFLDFEPLLGYAPGPRSGDTADERAVGEGKLSTLRAEILVLLPGDSVGCHWGGRGTMGLKGSFTAPRQKCQCEKRSLAQDRMGGHLDRERILTKPVLPGPCLKIGGCV